MDRADIELIDFYLQLVRVGIGTSECVTIPSIIDWSKLKTLASESGLSAIVLDGLDRCINERDIIPKKVRLEWIGQVLSTEGKYDAYRKAIGELAGVYNRYGFQMMVLKGYACSLNWPQPNHRPCGDIDIWLFGKQKESDALLSKELGIAVDNSHHHHTVFYWHGFMVENHYDFINIHHHRSNHEFEKILKEQGKDDSHFVIVEGEKVYLPSANLHALFILKHAMMEFAAKGINLRQVLDWAFFVKVHGKDVNWIWLIDILDHFGMKSMFGIINAICFDELGFDMSLFPEVPFNPSLKARVLYDVLSPEIPRETHANPIHRLLWKYRRWGSNEWKHKLCYKESMWSAFWSGVWNHLLKPSSF